MKPSRKLQKEMTPWEGVNCDEIKAFMCGLIKAGRGVDALYNHTVTVMHIWEIKPQHKCKILKSSLIAKYQVFDPVGVNWQFYLIYFTLYFTLKLTVDTVKKKQLKV